MQKTDIEWCDYTWNPVTNCLHGCEYCYAEKKSNQFNLFKKGVNTNEQVLFFENICGLEKGTDFTVENGCIVLNTPISWGDRRQGFPTRFDTPTLHRYRLNEPQSIKKPQNIFVVSMGDLFGAWVSDSWIQEVFKACEAAPWHRYLFLTKNPGRYGILNGLDHKYDWAWVKNNWWFGITITDIFDLPTKMRYLPYGKANTFLSIEPLLEPIDLSFYFPKATTHWKCSFCGHFADAYSLHCSHCDKEGGYSGSFRQNPINWVIIGAETGNRKGKVIPKREWIENIVEQCRAANVPVFMKRGEKQKDGTYFMENLMGADFVQEYPW